MSAAWLLLALALVILPVRPTGRENGRGAGHQMSRERGRGGPVPRTASSTRRAPLAALSSGAVCLTLVGGWPGAGLALVIIPATWWGLRRALMLDSAAVPEPELPLVLDLCAAALHAGRPLADALTAAAPAAPPALRQALDHVAGLLRLGAEPRQAWSVLSRDGPLGELAVIAVRSAASGARLAHALERLAGEQRATLAAAAAVRAQRAGVSALAPLAACFLPSFVVLGIVPVVVGMGRLVLDGGMP